MHSHGKSILSFILLAGQILWQQNVLAEGELCYNAVNEMVGTCVKIEKCEPYKSLLKNHGVWASDVLHNALCYHTYYYPVVCCPYSRKKSLSYGSLSSPVCGFSDGSHVRTFLPGGFPAEVNAYPWLAALGYQSSPDEPVKWKCSGSLISDRHILTSSQCTYGRNDLKIVRLGDHDLYNDDDGAHPIDVPIDYVIIHPNYQNTGENVVNDIALIRLQSDIDFDHAIHPICLPLTEELKNRNYTRHYPLVAGWGSLQRDGIAKHSLLESGYPVLSTDKCRTAVTKGFKNQEIDERVLCTGYIAGRGDVCVSDRGSPLMFPKNKSFYAIGVLSSGVDCENDRYPFIYTRVSHYLDFILDNLY